MPPAYFCSELDDTRKAEIHRCVQQESCCSFRPRKLQGRQDGQQADQSCWNELTMSSKGDMARYRTMVHVDRSRHQICGSSATGWASTQGATEKAKRAPTSRRTRDTHSSRCCKYLHARALWAGSTRREHDQPAAAGSMVQPHGQARYTCMWRHVQGMCMLMHGACRQAIKAFVRDS